MISRSVNKDLSLMYMSCICDCSYCTKFREAGTYTIICSVKWLYFRTNYFLLAFSSYLELVKSLPTWQFHKCSRQTENVDWKWLMLNNVHFMPHMMAYVLKFKITYLNGPRYFPNFSAVHPNKNTCDKYTNDRHLWLCFPTVILNDFE